MSMRLLISLFYQARILGRRQEPSLTGAHPTGELLESAAGGGRQKTLK